MKDLEESKNEIAVRKIIDIITHEKFKTETQLKILRKFKLTLNKSVPTLESTLINDWDIEVFLDAVSMSSREGNETDAFQTEYFSFLLELACYSSKLHDKIRIELVRLLRTEITCGSLINNLWIFLENKSFVWVDVIQEILPRSKLFFEEKVFQWVTGFLESNISLEELNIKYYAQLSAHCCKIFQMISTILNEFVNLTKGNERILILAAHFAALVSLTCDEHGKEFFRLYPRSLSHIVSLLIMTPETYSVLSKKNCTDFSFEGEVLELLLDAFSGNENYVLQLLTHFPHWLIEFSTYKR